MVHDVRSAQVTLLDGYVPVIDLGLDRATGGAHRRDVGRAIDTALSTSGFLVVLGHGVPQQTIAAAYERLTEFFTQPAERKDETLMEPSDQLYRGFTRITPGIHEQFTANRIGELPPDEVRYTDGRRLLGPNRWPDLTGFRAAYLDYYAAVETFSRELLRLFALGLDLPERWFDGRFDDHMSPLTTNYYLPQPEAPLPDTVRNEEHRDWGTVTILYQDDAPGGLQVRGRQGEWLDVPPVAGSFVVNLGRLMSKWTNERWASTVHRVIHPPRAEAHRGRISIAFFYQPNPDAVIDCIPTCADAREPQHAPVRSSEYFLRMVRRAHLRRRLRVETSA